VLNNNARHGDSRRLLNNQAFTYSLFSVPASVDTYNGEQYQKRRASSLAERNLRRTCCACQLLTRRAGCLPLRRSCCSAAMHASRVQNN